MSKNTYIYNDQFLPFSFFVFLKFYLKFTQSTCDAYTSLVAMKSLYISTSTMYMLHTLQTRAPTLSETVAYVSQASLS